MTNQTKTEEAILGGMLISERACCAALELLQPEDFRDPFNRFILNAIWDESEKGEKIDAETILRHTDTHVGYSFGGPNTGVSEKLLMMMAGAASARKVASLARKINRQSGRWSDLPMHFRIRMYFRHFLEYRH